ncbi:hypothetical protein PR202_ga09847 [Eleusine coracana subsp. coracana]|uniref:Uncharacterized protein n=1 Tax=Eleusine coracana subsp. coracana TaxID=191504 RepID=A0AAV5C4T9_ELECO|nr:hypothetical protein PR202_ga09847 [Eleusine coracana subsp. coracana]
MTMAGPPKSYVVLAHVGSHVPPNRESKSASFTWCCRLSVSGTTCASRRSGTKRGSRRCWMRSWRT